MKILKIALILLAITTSTLSVGQDSKQGVDMQKKIQELPWHDFDKMVEIANADYGKCYTIRGYRICPEKKLILTESMYGTASRDAVGFFPEPSLKYGEDVMIIFAGQSFFDKSDLKINWQTVKLLSHSEYDAEFTDGVALYHIAYGSFRVVGEYDQNTYKPAAKSATAKRNLDGMKELTEAFYVKGDKFYFAQGSLVPILESFDVPNLHTIVSESGFETDYITDGKKVIFGGEKTGYSSKQENGQEYVISERWAVEDIDFDSLRVLGKDMLVDDESIYYGTEVIPFDKLNGFKFIVREML